jgi:hypothetical protein
MQDYSANITIWSHVESGIGIIAVSIPPLRRLFACLKSTMGSSVRSKDSSQQGIPGCGPGYAKESRTKSDK